MIVAVPLRLPAVPVFMPTLSAVLLDPAARLLNDPLAVSPLVPVAMLPFNPSAGPLAMLLMFSATGATTAPTRTLPNTTGFGVAALACARLPAIPLMVPLNARFRSASGVKPRPLPIAVPFEVSSNWYDAVIAPAVVGVSVTCIDVASVSPASKPRDRPAVVAEAPRPGVGQPAEGHVQRFRERARHLRVGERDRLGDRTAAHQHGTEVEIPRIVDRPCRQVVARDRGMTTCGARSRVASPLLPVPLDARFSVTLPFCTPALAAVIPTLIALLLLPAARLTIGPPLPWRSRSCRHWR